MAKLDTAQAGPQVKKGHRLITSYLAQLDAPTDTREWFCRQVVLKLPDLTPL
jgi:hypothetical protein